QRGSGGGAGHRVVLLSVFINLNLAGDGDVLPLDLNSVTGLDVDGLILLVQLIALCGLQLPDVEAALALGQRLINIDVAILVGGVLPDGVLVGVIQKELYIINSLAGNGINLVDDDAAEGLILHLENRGLAILHLKIVGGIVQLEPLSGLDLHGVVGAILQGKERTAVLIRGDGVDQLVVDL